MNCVMFPGKTPRILPIQHTTGEDNALNAEKLGGCLCWNGI